MGLKFRTPSAERQARAQIEDRMAHSLSSWHGPHTLSSRCARAVWEKNHGTRKPGNFQLMGSVRPSPYTTGFNRQITEFDWGKMNFSHGDLSLSISSETYSVELDRRGATLYEVIDGKVVREYPKNVWVRISESAAMAYYEISDVADIVVVRQSFEGQRIIPIAGKTIFDNRGRKQVITTEQTRKTSLRIIDRTNQFIADAKHLEYFIPLFMPEDSAQFPKVFLAKTDELTIIGIGAAQAAGSLSSDTNVRAVFGLSGFIEIGHSFALVRGMHINTVKDPNTGIIESKFFEVELPLELVQRGFRLKSEYLVKLASDDFLEIR